MSGEDDTGVTRREKRRQETTERILDAAMRLMIEQSYEGFTIARLAKELDYAVGALYRYFKGKDAILLALELRCLARIRADLERVGTIVSASDGDEAELELLHVIAGLGIYESLTHRRPTDHRLLTLSLGDPRELMDVDVATHVLTPLREVLNLVGAHLDRAAELGALQPGDANARMIVLWGAMQGIMQLRKLQRVDETMAERGLVNQMMHGLLVGWGASEPRVRALQDQATKIIDGL